MTGLAQGIDRKTYIASHSERRGRFDIHPFPFRTSSLPIFKIFRSSVLAALDKSEDLVKARNLSIFLLRFPAHFFLPFAALQVAEEVEAMLLDPHPQPGEFDALPLQP